MLAGCDRDTAAGRRDFAVLSLLVRLGLRGGEVAGLQLDDIDWRAGEIVVSGKGSRGERLPLPADVGQAWPATWTRPAAVRGAVGVRAVAAPPAADPSRVRAVVGRAGARAGLERVARTGCGTPRPPRCCGPGRRCPRSGRCCGTVA